MNTSCCTDGLYYLSIVSPGHPWISFYTDPTLKASNAEQKKNHVRSISRHLTFVQGPESERKRAASLNSLCDDSSPPLATTSTNDLVDDYDDEEDDGLIDVLASAISRVRISEPKRSRICSPSRVIEESPSTLKTSNLCTAF